MQLGLDPGLRIKLNLNFVENVKHFSHVASSLAFESRGGELHR